MRVPPKLRALARNPLVVQHVDLRATRVAAIVRSDARTYSENVDQTGLTSFRATPDRFSVGSPARALALGRGGTHWALGDDYDPPYSEGLPIHSVIYRRTRGCLQRETITATSQPAVTDLTVDDTTLYLIAPAMGIVRHTFTPEPTPAC